MRLENNAEYVVEALEGHDVGFLGRIATKLKQEFGGEGWAIGEAVERAINQYGKCGVVQTGRARDV